MALWFSVPALSLFWQTCKAPHCSYQADHHGLARGFMRFLRMLSVRMADFKACIASVSDAVELWRAACLYQRTTPSEEKAPYDVMTDAADAVCIGRKLADTPFPFPWAQMVLVLLLIFAGTLPLMVVAFIDKLWLAVIIDFFSVQAYWALNEVARDVEDPWVYEPNDLPLARLQVQLHVLLHFVLVTACISSSPCKLV